MGRMVDSFLENGFNYFDTAHGYVEGKSETALRDCLVNRYPRDASVESRKCYEVCKKYGKPVIVMEPEAIVKVREIFRAQGLIPCTACRYCTDGCPKQIAIPDLFVCLNAKKQFRNWNTDYYYNNVHTKEGSRASDCIKCGKCEHICPQHLPIRELLMEVAEEFD